MAAEEKIKFTVYLPASLHKKAVEAAEKSDRSLNKYIVSLIRSDLEKSEPGKRSQR